MAKFLKVKNFTENLLKNMSIIVINLLIETVF